MSTECVQTIIGRAVLEPDFRALLFSQPEKALEGYELTSDELASLKCLKPEEFDVIASQVEERISKSGIGIINLREAVACDGASKLTPIVADILRTSFKY